MPRIHVVPHPDGWAIKRERATRASAVHGTKEQALRNALAMARNSGDDVVVHGRDNRIQKVITPREISEGGNCFLTTACVEFFHLKDNCYQLNTLRKFRDTILQKTESGKQLIILYYSVAPNIVTNLKKDKEKNILFELVMKEINNACIAFKIKNYKRVILIYKRVVIMLANRYGINLN
jgi:hypothetical protein